MIFKVFFEIRKKHTDHNENLCKVMAVEKETDLEDRIENVVKNLKADGYEMAFVRDCFNISKPTNDRCY